ncbi:hypothetical protein A2U01_0060779 [Trifolium medium]|uniref:Uncharacterized protein n=1 Tax=Trifolium medium TaxID=97028 RepID=A0A392RTS5_9FABA|nr:hypothetical protein [Trifolium medium]
MSAWWVVVPRGSSSVPSFHPLGLFYPFSAGGLPSLPLLSRRPSVLRRCPSVHLCCYGILLVLALVFGF